MTRTRQRTLAALITTGAMTLTGALLFGFDPVLKTMLAPRADDLFWLFAVALLGHVAIAEWRASRPLARPRALIPANDDRHRPEIEQAA